MPVWVGDLGGNPRSVSRIWFGSPYRTLTPVKKVWVGDDTGTARLVFTNEATLTLLANPQNYQRIDLNWGTGVVGVAPFTLKRGTKTIYQGSATSYQDTGLSPDRTYNYQVFDSTNRFSDKVSATTPSPSTQQKTVTLSVKASGSYTGSGTLRSTSNRYFGYYSSTWGTQQSQACFSIPGDVAGCVSVDKVELSWKVLHTYLGAGTTVSLNLTRQNFTTPPATLPTTSGKLLARGSSSAPLTFSAKPGQYIGGSTWLDLNARVSGGSDIFNEFRDNNARGLGIVSAVSGTSGYGYADAAPRLRLTYTVNA